MHPYLNVPTPHVLAHQGLALGNEPNSIPAFGSALDAGADFIETDAHGTRDGIAVLFHDDTLDGKRISEYDFAELPSYIPTLEEALNRFPEARFNIDIKNSEASVPVAQVLNALGAHNRVLLTSFSARRRKDTMALAPGTASSPAVTEFTPALLAALCGLQPLVTLMLKRFDAVQIPTRGAGINTVSPRLVQMFHKAGVLVHVWTINDPEQMRLLISAGIDGIVTDRTDLALPVLKHQR